METAISSPILILTCRAEGYLAEILKAEGFNEFSMDNPGNLSWHSMDCASADIIILGETELTAGQSASLRSYVQTGGNLIAFRPDRQLDDVFGIAHEGKRLEGGYLGISQDSALCEGLTDSLMQIHGSIEQYTLKGAAAIANLYTGRNMPAGMPAATFSRFGSGNAAAFAYSMAWNIILTRQGNPEHAGQEKDGINGLRPMDMFTEGWVDPETIGHNQADEQMRLLTRIIETMSASRKPLPRLWYFPDARKSCAVLTNDSEFSTGEALDSQLAEIQGKGAGMTVYLLDTSNVSRAQTDQWIMNGHEIAAHPGLINHEDQNAYANNPTWAKASGVVKAKVKEIAEMYGRPTHTCTNHWFVWCGENAQGEQDFSAMAKIYADNGIEMDCNYSVYDNFSNQGEFLGGRTRPGNFNGSGLPMKLADAEGNVLDVYQLINNVYDQLYEEHNDAAGFFRCFKTILDASLEGETYSWLNIKSHNCRWSFLRTAVLDMLEYANLKGIPVVTAEKCLDFIKMKDEAHFSDIKWVGNTLSFVIQSERRAAAGLTFTLPAQFNSLSINAMEIDSRAADYEQRTIKGREYALSTVDGSRDHNITALYRQH